ncbi:MAG: nitroreductase family deazaflavin-dependent oxidoreductase [Acidimicrobiia bacterium]|nr:nitroreductase family deazaflavin-dependent oxidoreductase [Acidimicrobiia bacterium]
MGLGKQLFKMMNKGHVWLYRTTNGRLGTMGGTVLLLTTRGAKSGHPRTNPLMGVAHDDGWLVAASAGGAPRHPAWYHNVVANPAVTVERGSEELPMNARVAGPEERPALWAKIVEFDTRFAGYETKVDREIPVVILEPKD